VADKLILVGRVAGAFGVKGEARVTAFTADPMNLATYGPLLNKAGAPALTILTARPAKAGIVARILEIDSPEAADALRGLELYVPRDRLPAPEDEDEFYLADLIGLAAESPAGEPLGVVLSVENYGAGDLIEVKPGGGAPSWQVAFTRETVPQVLTAQGRIVINRPDEIQGEPT
jgi:16S rRNA processing protein RimM